MIRSMTGFGRSEADWEGGRIRAEVRCVNSRHLDLRLRLPRELAGLEPGLRARIGQRFARGQVDVQVRLPPDAPLEPTIDVSNLAVRRYLEAAAELRAEFALGGELSVSELLPLPGVAQLREPELEPEWVAAAVAAAVETASAEAADMRAREGEALDRELRERLDELEKLVVEIESRAEDVRRGVRERLLRRIEQLRADVELDPVRLDQEVLYHVDRMDVTEETVRLRSHLAQFRETLELEGAVGRRLEFILQEMGRESNTIGSKAQDAPTGRAVVELRVGLEKLREQVLNVE